MNQKFFKIKYINERKHSRVNNMKLTIMAKIRETRVILNGQIWVRRGGAGAWWGRGGGAKDTRDTPA